MALVKRDLGGGPNSRAERPTKGITQGAVGREPVETLLPAGPKHRLEAELPRLADAAIRVRDAP